MKYQGTEGISLSRRVPAPLCGQIRTLHVGCLTKYRDYRKSSFKKASVFIHLFNKTNNRVYEFGDILIPKDVGMQTN